METEGHALELKFVDSWLVSLRARLACATACEFKREGMRHRRIPLFPTPRFQAEDDQTVFKPGFGESFSMPGLLRERQGKLRRVGSVGQDCNS